MDDITTTLLENPEVFTAIEEFDQSDLAELEALLGQSASDLSFFTSPEFISMAIGAWVAFGILFLIIYILYAIGLHKAGNALKVKHAWLAWIPGLSDYVSMSIAGITFKFFFFYVFLIPILGSLIGALLEMSQTSIVPIIGATISILSAIFSIGIWLWICRRVANVAQSGWGMTIGLFFLPFIFFWVVGNKLRDIGYENLDQSLISSDTSRKYLFIFTLVFFVLWILLLIGISIGVVMFASNEELMNGVMSEVLSLPITE